MYSEMSESEVVSAHLSVDMGGAASAPVEADTCLCFVLHTSVLEH